MLFVMLEPNIGVSMTNNNPSSIYSKAYELMTYPLLPPSSSTNAHFIGTAVGQMFMALPLVQNLPSLVRVSVAEILHEFTEVMIRGSMAVNLYDKQNYSLYDIISPFMSKPVKTLVTAFSAYGVEQFVASSYSLSLCCAPVARCAPKVQFCQPVVMPMHTKTVCQPHIFNQNIALKATASALGALFAASLYDALGGAVLDDYVVKSWSDYSNETSLEYQIETSGETTEVHA